MAQLESNDYIVITSDMITQLNLSGNRLMIYALIHGFSKNGENEFYGSIDYIRRWTNLSRRCVIDTLNHLVADGLIAKREEFRNGVKFCYYAAICTGGANSARGVQMTAKGSAKSAPGVVQNLHGGSANSAPNNIIDNTNINNIYIADSCESERASFQNEFSEAWVKYLRKGSKKKSYVQWQKLSSSDRINAIEFIDRYFAAREFRYRKDFERYLSDRVWEGNFDAPPENVPKKTYKKFN